LQASGRERHLVDISTSSRIDDNSRCDYRLASVVELHPYDQSLIAIARASWRTYRKSGDFAVLFPFVAVVAVSANAVLQEEAFFSPLALGFSLLLGGVTLGSHWNRVGRI